MSAVSGKGVIAVEGIRDFDRGYLVKEDIPSGCEPVPSDTFQPFPDKIICLRRVSEVFKPKQDVLEAIRSSGIKKSIDHFNNKKNFYIITGSIPFQLDHLGRIKKEETKDLEFTSLTEKVQSLVIQAIERRKF